MLGNRLTGPGGAVHTWDALGRMLSLAKGGATTSYAYRADGMRTLKSSPSGSSVYRYDGQMGVETVELAANGSVSAVERRGLGARGLDLIERTTQTGTLTGFPLYDAHGNNVATLTRSGASWSVGDERSYDAWGRVRGGAQTGAPSSRYCASLGHVQDDESGLVYMRARYYEPGTGRFVSEDPAHEGRNWLVYVHNNPVGSKDPSGLGPPGQKDGKDDDDFGWTDPTNWFPGVVQVKAFWLFDAALRDAKDGNDVESAWGDFMRRWAGNELTRDPMLIWSIKSNINGSGLGAAHGIAFKLATLTKAYELRLEWYLKDIDRE